MTRLAEKLFYALPYALRRAVFALIRRERFRALRCMRETPGEYSYQPFDRHRCIFIHVPKAAGSSICYSLFNCLAGGHVPAQHYQIVFAQKEFDAYFKFTFVRNPWDRAFSAYRRLEIGATEDFSDFIVNRLHTVQTMEHFKPQFHFVCLSNGKLGVDFLGFYENLEADFAHIKKQLGFDAETKLLHERRTLPPADYREYYNDASRRRIADMYRRDIELFGYDFDNSSLATQLNKRRAL